MDPKKPEKDWGLCLLTIFQRLNRDSNAPSMSIPSYLNVSEYAVSFMWQSCNSERAGSHINRVKTRERTGAVNNAPVHEIDTPRLVPKWRAEGHLTAATFGSIDEDQSKVMKRHLESKSPRYLLNKEDALASYIRDSESAYDRVHS